MLSEESVELGAEGAEVLIRRCFYQAKIFVRQPQSTWDEEEKVEQRSRSIRPRVATVRVVTIRTSGVFAPLAAGIVVTPEQPLRVGYRVMPGLVR